MELATFSRIQVDYSYVKRGTGNPLPKSDGVTKSKNKDVNNTCSLYCANWDTEPHNQVPTSANHPTNPLSHSFPNLLADPRVMLTRPITVCQVGPTHLSWFDYTHSHLTRQGPARCSNQSKRRGSTWLRRTRIQSLRSYTSWTPQPSSGQSQRDTMLLLLHACDMWSHLL